jgi:membrane-bound lytic murein transglycosylase B
MRALTPSSALSRALSLPLAALLAVSASVGARAAEPAEYAAGRSAYIADLANEPGFRRDALTALLERARYRPAIIEAMERPYEAQPWHRYRQLFLTPERITAGIAYWRAHAQTLNQAEATYGVPPQVIVAIIGVETFYGRRIGDHPVLDALTTLAFAYPKRAAFFRDELTAFLRLSQEEGLDPLKAVGSYAGAMGKPQFIASSYRAYAVDFNGDGRRDLWHSDADVIGSVANYFRSHGWQPGEPVVFGAAIDTGRAKLSLDGIRVAEKAPLAPSTTGATLRMAGVDWREPVASDTPTTLIRLDGAGEEYWVGLRNFYVITRYNHSNLYAMAVHQLSEAIRAGYAERGA